MPRYIVRNQLAAIMLHFDLTHELAILHSEERWHQAEHNAKALVKESSLRVVLVVMKRGAKLPVHRAPAPITLQTLQGRLRVHLPGQTVDLPASGLLVLDGNVEHDVEASEESAFLLTLTWTSARGEETPFTRPTDQTLRKLDVREIVPRERHELIFATFSALSPGEAFDLVNDHDPKPLT